MPLFSIGKPTFDATKVKVNIKMAITRIRMQQNKLVNSVKVQRRQLSELISIGKYDSARIKVEALLREDVSIEGLEVLALFADLIASRIQTIAQSGSQCPPELKEAVTSVLWGAARCETIMEFATVRKHLEAKYGKAFVEGAERNSEFSVNERMLERLGMGTPGNEQCINYLRSIAKEYGQTFNEDAFSDVGPSLVPRINTEPNSAIGVENLIALGGIQTLSGFVIPPTTTPQDPLEARMLLLLRQ